MRTSSATLGFSMLALLGITLSAGEARAGVTVTFTGSSTVEMVPGFGAYPAAENYQFTVTFTNNTTSAHHLDSATYYLMSRNGFMTWPQTQLDTDAGAFPATIAPGGGVWWWEPSVGGIGTAGRVVVRSVIDGNMRLTQIPLPRAGYTAPPDTIDIDTPLNLAVNGPLVVVPFSDGLGTAQSDWSGIWIPAQLQTFGGDVKLSSYDVEITDANHTSIWSDTRPVAPLPNTTTTTVSQAAPYPYSFLARFPAGFVLPLQVSITVYGVDAGGNPLLESKSYSATSSNPAPGFFPLSSQASGLSICIGNGPGEFDSIHSTIDEEAFAYDIGACDVNGDDHDGSSNGDYYIWNQPIVAAQAGTVVFLDDTHPDNPTPGVIPNNAINNVLIIQDAAGVYWEYMHMRPYSSSGLGLSVNSAVRIGQPIARVGNTGDSSGPHLHFESFILDAEGHVQPYPMKFTNLDSHETRTHIPNVPLGTWAYSYDTGSGLVAFYDVHNGG